MHTIEHSIGPASGMFLMDPCAGVQGCAISFGEPRLLEWSAPIPFRRGRTRATRPCPRRRSDRREAGQADHARHEREVPSDPVPLGRQAAPRQHSRPAPGAGRPIRCHLQLGTPASAAARPGTPQSAWTATPKADPSRPATPGSSTGSAHLADSETRHGSSQPDRIRPQRLLLHPHEPRRPHRPRH